MLPRALSSPPHTPRPRPPGNDDAMNTMPGRRAFFATRTLIALALFSATPCAMAEPGHKFDPLSSEDIRKIACAIPAQAQARPKQPRRLLIFYRAEGYVHASIPYANEAFGQLGAHTGAYTAEISDDMGVFTPQRLARYDAVLFNNTTELNFADPAQRQALLDFVARGKGVIGIHAASDSFYTWPEGQALLGGQFKSHPWTAKDTVAVKLDDPAHPLVAAFAGKGFWIRDEIYQIVGSYSRSSQRVLLSLDMSQPENARPPDMIVRSDNDFPIAWIRQQGRGRVFYTSLGHNPELYETRQILQHYLDGIQYALGDLRALSESSATLPHPATPALAPRATDGSVNHLNPVPCS